MTAMSMPDVAISTHFVPGLVALSVFVAALAGYIALDLVQRSATAPAHARRILIGMLSLEMAMPASYDPVLVALSMLAAILGSGVALALVARARARVLDLFT